MTDNWAEQVKFNNGVNSVLESIRDSLEGLKESVEVLHRRLEALEDDEQ